MRRLSSQKGKKGKNAASKEDNEPEPTSDVEAQGNGNPAPSDDDESIFEKKGTQNQNKKNKRGKKSIAEKESNAEKGDDASDDNVPLNSAKKKKGKKGRKTNDREDGSDAGENEGKEEAAGDEDYEAEKVVDARMSGSTKQYRIRWKGYGEEHDTWEKEADLNCPDLLEEFTTEHPDAFKKADKVSGKSEPKKRKKPTNSAEPKKKKENAVEPVSEEGGEKVYEVEKVVEVHFKRNGEREFLIRWKGFSSDDDTWEPESNLNCTDLIDKFMEKVQKAKEAGLRELRANPQVTNRFTLNTREPGRRLSSRNTGRQRATYYNAE